MADYGTYQDHRLVDLLNQGDRTAYTEIYNRYAALVYAFAYKRTDEKAEAQDIVHEVFLYLWEQRTALTITHGLLPFIYTAVKNRILNRIKHKRVSERYLDAFQAYLDTSEDNADHLLRHNELATLIEREIAALPPKMRQVFELSRKDGYTRKAIAQELDLSEQTVKSHMQHALKILKEKLGSKTFFIFF